MQRQMRTSIFSLTILIMGCASSSTKNYLDKANRRDFSIDAMGGAYAVSLFPKTYGAMLGPAFSLVLVSPVLVGDEVLYNSGTSSIIPWFNARGVSVWLVRIPAQTNLERFGRDALPLIATAIRKNSTDDDWVMGGVSLGGQAIAEYLNLLEQNATVTGMQVKAAFFLGTGFDYAYPNSFGERLLNMKHAELCKDDFCARYLPGVKPEHTTLRKNLSDSAGKPVWKNNLDSILLKGKPVRVMFVAGKIDNVAPSESVYKFFLRTVGDVKYSPNHRFLQPGRMNRHSRDYDHAMLLGSDELASEILPEILKFIDL